MGRARTRLIAVAVAAAASAPVPSNAAIQCKDALAHGGLALSQNDAINAWITYVANMFGASWSNFNLATNKVFYETNLGVAVMQQVSAIPCREVVDRFPVVQFPLTIIQAP